MYLRIKIAKPVDFSFACKVDHNSKPLSRVGEVRFFVQLKALQYDLGLKKEKYHLQMDGRNLIPECIIEIASSLCSNKNCGHFRGILLVLWA